MKWLCMSLALFGLCAATTPDPTWVCGNALGACIQGACPQNYECRSNICCPRKVIFRGNFLGFGSSSDEKKKKTSPTTPTTPTTPSKAHWCVDGAINCAQFTQYCKPGTQYTAFMLRKCIQTCGVCKYGQ
ncbi:unnamed protein product [Bursaphelenchus xylophilus]|uniref:(pine wood nematode) hypothetical protein n=1 Tax=Bursaphelenchus xylophilus TaxID=6326 RepID=A0A1I7RM81_BURXY|nr:unnamed protein product [Bursaphelenchus xylophilus]CAG9118280.1 unnamed protein product [Bursaphelenchus xylophilus]